MRSAAGELPGVLSAGLDDLESGLRIDVADGEVAGMTDAVRIAVGAVSGRSVSGRLTEVLELLVIVPGRRGVSGVILT